ncbi:zinc-binding alcohol dehydrogenase [Allokutzneria sp. A3M-2-11 16]|uniref:zinc-binding dehydrogenase n=1 Tax=Allokutzneria sp. A3M-2-11 16 TaxID=2962043 RepID=UPI0020B7D12F|nr:zinc-binding dehydrogenase [Allokutzneria sp. A3M-2-11 16]MCP3800821.1 zinc-binding alcohol dehydrogenase [Allokutzneria sp. A3M-2-11 16]
MPKVVQFSAPRSVELVEEPGAPLASGQVRVRTLYSGISAGTELTAYRGSNPYLSKLWDAERRLFVDGTPSFGYPVAGWGYQEVGVVTETTVPDLEVGQRVWGIWGHRSSAVVDAAKLAGHVLPDSVPPVAGVFARLGAIALNAVLDADIHLGEDVAVFGQGVLGLLTTRLATLNGARVVAVDALPRRLALAAEQGAVLTLNAIDDAVAERIAEHTGGRGADTSIEISGSAKALHEAIRSVGVAGRVVASGFYQGDAVGLRLGEEFHHNRVRLVASQIGGVNPELSQRWSVERLQRTFMELVVAGTLDPLPLVTHVMCAHDVAKAFAEIDERPADTLQVVLDFADVDGE